MTVSMGASERSQMSYTIKDETVQGNFTSAGKLHADSYYTWNVAI